jgi:hypothetical protein
MQVKDGTESIAGDVTCLEHVRRTAIPNLKQNYGGSGAISRPASMKRNKSSQESKIM